MSPRGGKREGAGRPAGSGRYGDIPTKIMRVPVSKLDDIHKLLADEPPTLVPLFSSKVAAGFPSPGDDYIEQYLDLNQLLIPRPASTFIVTAEGDSMTGAGIQSGDMLIVDRSLPPLDGKIVIAALNGELTVKRLSKTKDVMKLLPANPAYKPIDITEDFNLVIWGVVTYVIHTQLKA